MLRSPAPGDEITIVVVALWTTGKLSDPVITTVKRQAGTGATTPPTTTPTQPSTPTTPAQPTPGVDRDLPANTTGISAILIVDPAAVASPDLAALGVGANAITRALGKGGGAWYVRNNTDSLVANLKPSWEGKQFPVLLVIDGKSNPKKVIGYEFTPTGNADQSARRIITMIANTPFVSTTPNPLPPTGP
jgi:hypothetical protein